MSESGDYNPGVWKGHDFASARRTYDAHVGRSYGDAVATGKGTKDLIAEDVKTDSTAPLIIVVDETGSMGDWPATMFSKLPYLENEGKEYLGDEIKSRIQYQMPVKHIDIKQVSLKNGNVIDVHPNISSALKKLGLPYDYRSLILGCINGKSASAVGYYWTTKNDFTIPSKKNRRPIYQYSKDNKLIGEYKSMMDAEKNTGVPFRDIWSCCKKRRLHAGNFIWRYKDE